MLDQWIANENLDIFFTERAVQTQGLMFEMRRKCIWTRMDKINFGGLHLIPNLIVDDVNAKITAMYLQHCGVHSATIDILEFEQKLTRAETLSMVERNERMIDA